MSSRKHVTATRWRPAVLSVLMAAWGTGQAAVAAQPVRPGALQKEEANVTAHTRTSTEPATVVRYQDFGALGDGKTDDIDAIAAAHDFANTHGLPVRADDDASYYIGGKKKTAIIRTDTHFGTARFIVDDTRVENRGAHIFEVQSQHTPIAMAGVASLKRNQRNVDVTLPLSCVVTVVDANVKRYIRYGLNRNAGTPQTDVFVVGRDGAVDMDAPIIWDFDQITEITARPIDKTPLTIHGGRFTTHANADESRYSYYARGIAIRRSNVVIDGLEHRITGEGDHGSPYGGFISIANCAYVTLRNAVLSGHKTYSTIGAAGKRVAMGTYDISISRAISVSLINCSQTNDILERALWGIMGSNYSKNILLDRCVLSRFDAHMGVANATIRHSKLGHSGINAIGSGTFTVENSTLYGWCLINLRPDYGSTWQGEFIIRNCVFVPSGGQEASAALIGGANSGQHNFGYTCYMPHRITIDTLHIDDTQHPAGYEGPAVFSNFNRNYKDDAYEEAFPYVKTEHVILKDVTTATGKPLHLSKNAVMFRDVKITQN